MASRPQNIGIKAIEIYFPSQVRSHFLSPTRPDVASTRPQQQHHGCLWIEFLSGC